MPYRDKDRLKESAKERMRRYRRNKKGVTPDGVTPDVTPDDVTPVTPDVVSVVVKLLKPIMDRLDILEERVRLLESGEPMGKVLKKVVTVQPRVVESGKKITPEDFSPPERIERRKSIFDEIEESRKSGGLNVEDLLFSKKSQAKNKLGRA